MSLLRSKSVTNSVSCEANGRHLILFHGWRQVPSAWVPNFPDFHAASPSSLIIAKRCAVVLQVVRRVGSVDT